MEKSKKKVCPGGPTADRSLNTFLGERTVPVDRSVDRTSGDAQATCPPVRKLWTAFLVSSHSLGWVNPTSPSGDGSD